MSQDLIRFHKHTLTTKLSCDNIVTTIKTYVHYPQQHFDQIQKDKSLCKKGDWKQFQAKFLALREGVHSASDMAKGISFLLIYQEHR